MRHSLQVVVTLCRVMEVIWSSKLVAYVNPQITGDPKMKFLRLFLSAVRRQPIRPTIKNFSWQCISIYVHSYYNMPI